MIIETSAVLAAFTLCIYATVADIRNGIIKNKVLAGYALLAIVLDAVLYSFFLPQLFQRFLLNSSIVAGLSLALFYTHVWAGGDCKLSCVLALLYPADMYLAYNNSHATLLLTVAIAFILGYFYLVINAVISLCKRKWQFSAQPLVVGIRGFLSSYICVSIYMAAVHLVMGLLIPGIYALPMSILLSINMLLAWGIGLIKSLRRKTVLGPVLIAVILVSVFTHRVPIGTDLHQYFLVFIVVLIQISITNQNYRTIPTSEVSKGMILSTATTALFQFSRVKGLPGLSAEDLRSRLTEEEADSVRRWGNSTKGQTHVVIVRKIPFAVFVACGFVLYFVIWSVLQYGIFPA